MTIPSASRRHLLMQAAALAFAPAAFAAAKIKPGEKVGAKLSEAQVRRLFSV